MAAVDGESARFHDRQLPDDRRSAVRRRSGDGDAAGPARGRRSIGARRRDARATAMRAHGDGRLPVAAGRAADARARDVAEGRRSGWCCWPAATKASTSACSSVASTTSSRSAITCCRAASCRRWCVIDALVRQLPGALNDPQSTRASRSSTGLLDCPHYTRPDVHEGIGGAAGAAVGQSRGDPALAVEAGAGHGHGSGGRTCCEARTLSHEEAASARRVPARAARRGEQ